MRDSFFVAALFLWLVTAAIVIFVREPAHAPWKKSQEGSIADDLRYARSNRLMFELLMAYFVLQGTIMMIQPVVTLYIGELQHSMSNAAVTAGTIMSCGGIAGALTTTFWGRLGQKKGYYRAICMTISGAGLGMLIQSIPDSIFWFGVCQAMVSCFIVGANPSLNAALVNGIYAHIYGLYTGGDSPTVPGLENVPGAFTFRKPLNQVHRVLKLCYNSFTQCIGCIKKRGKLCRD